MNLQQCLKPEYPVACVALVLLGAMTWLASGAEVQLHRGRLSPNDYRFAVDVARGNIMEVDLGRLAVAKTGNLRVKQFGEEMIRDHELDNEELDNVLSENGATMPQGLTDAQQTEVNRLNKLSGREFDRQYLALMVREHVKYLTDFRDASMRANSPDLRSFAGNTARVIQYDLNMVGAFRKGR